MSKYRIYQLAKEFSLDSKKIIDILNKNNINVSNNLNLVGEKEREVIASIVNNKDNNKQQTAKKNNQQNVNHKNNNSANNNNNNNKTKTIRIIHIRTIIAIILEIMLVQMNIKQKILQ